MDLPESLSYSILINFECLKNSLLCLLAGRFSFVVIESDKNLHQAINIFHF